MLIHHRYLKLTLTYTHFVIYFLIHMAEKLGRMRSGEKSKGKNIFTEKTLNRMHNHDL